MFKKKEKEKKLTDSELNQVRKYQQEIVLLQQKIGELELAKTEILEKMIGVRKHQEKFIRKIERKYRLQKENNYQLDINSGLITEVKNN